MNSDDTPRQKHVWPKYLLAAVLLGILLAVLAVMKEATRIRNMQRVDPLESQPTPHTQPAK